MILILFRNSFNLKKAYLYYGTFTKIKKKGSTKLRTINYVRRRSIYTCNASKQSVNKMHHDVTYILFFDPIHERKLMRIEWETYGKESVNDYNLEPKAN